MVMMMQRMGGMTGSSGGGRNFSTGSCASRSGDPLALREWFGTASASVSGSSLGLGSSSRELLELYCSSTDEAKHAIHSSRNTSGLFRTTGKSLPISEFVTTAVAAGEMEDDCSIDFMEACVSKQCRDTSSNSNNDNKHVALSSSLDAIDLEAAFGASVAAAAAIATVAAVPSSATHSQLPIPAILDESHPDPFSDIFESSVDDDESLFDFSEEPPPEEQSVHPPPPPTRIVVHSNQPLEAATSRDDQTTLMNRAVAVTVGSAATAATATTTASGKPKRRRRVRKAKQYETTEYTELDVLLGRGGLINHHPGNKAYLQEKTRLQDRYLTASRTTKTQISLELVDWVYARGGRFMDKCNDCWYQVDRKRARAKASQTLREI